MRTKLWIYGAVALVMIFLGSLLGTCGKGPSGSSTTSDSMQVGQDSVVVLPPSVSWTPTGNAVRDSACKKVAEVEARKIESSKGFWIATILGVLALIVWTTWRYFNRTKKQRTSGKWEALDDKDKPPATAIVVLAVVPIMCWLIWAVFPNAYSILWNEPIVKFPVLFGLVAALMLSESKGMLKTSSRLLLKSAIVAVLFTAGVTYIKYEYNKYLCHTPEAVPDPPSGITLSSSDTFSILIGRDWSERVEVPLYHRLRWDRADINVAYQAKTQAGEIRNYPRGDPTRRKIRGRLTHVQFRVTEPGVDTLRVRLELSRIDESRGISLGIHIGAH